MADQLIDRTDEQLLQAAEAALKGVFAAIDAGDWGVEHAADCPEDDTCECVATKVARTASDALNAIEYRLRFAVGNRVARRHFALTTAHKVKKLEGNQVVTKCDEIHHHEGFYVVEQRPELTPVPACHVCFPEEQEDFLPPGTHLAIHGSLGRDGKRVQNIGCMDTGRSGWTLRAAMQAADEGDSGAIVEVITRKTCPTHGVGGEEEGLYDED